MTECPKISIVTPSFNQGKFLEKTILSVLEQGYPNLEYIIIDGGSTDESVEIIKKYADRLAYWVSEPDRGQSHAINKGFERATGEIFGWLNSDDWYHPGALQAVAEAFAANPDAGAVVGVGDMFFEGPGHTSRVEPFPVTMNSLYGAVDRFFMQPSCYFRKEAWLTAGPLDETLNLAMDLDLWLKLAKKYSFALTEQNLSVSLVHALAKTTELGSHSLVDACLVIMRHGGEKEGRQRLIQFVQDLLDTRKELSSVKEQLDFLQKDRERLIADRDGHLAELNRIIAVRDQQLAVRDEQFVRHEQLLASRLEQVVGSQQIIQSLRNSLSWKITAPIRWLHSLLFPAKKQDVEPVSSEVANTFFSSLLDRESLPTIPERTQTVDVIIPIYNGYDVACACLESVWANSNNCRIIVVNDASTDPRINEMLLGLKALSERNLAVEIIKNEHNLGFLKSVNKAFNSTKTDFVLLNSDTEVPPGWLDRLFAPFIINDSVATVTPFSNAATICSFPESCKDNYIFRDMGVAELDSYFSNYLPAEPIEIPTGVGFCMAFKREVVVKLGLFDENAFGRGYCEENDFSLRAGAAGYRNVLVPNLFVYHKHGGSFSVQEKNELFQSNFARLIERYPDYAQRVKDFITIDPTRQIRESLAFLTAALEGKNRATVAIIDFDLGGGAKVYSSSLIEELVAAGHKVIHCKHNYLHNRLYIDFSDAFGCQQVVLHGEQLLLNKLLHLLQVDFVMVSQLVSWPRPIAVMEQIQQAEIPYLVFMHDFFLVCPKYVLIDQHGAFCNIPENLGICQVCLQHNKLYDLPIIPDPLMKDIGLWRKKVMSFLSGARSVVCFSESTRGYLRRVYPELTNLMVNEHFIPQQEIFPRKLRKFNIARPLTVAVLGGIQFAKGLEVLTQLVESSEFTTLPLKVVVIGALQTFPPSYQGDHEKFKVIGEYNRETLPMLMEQQGVDLVLIPSIWPETFSYTTSEALLMGYPVICFNVGAPAERVRKSGCGLVVEDISLRGLLDTFNKIIDSPGLVAELSLRTQNYVPKTAEEHFGAIKGLIEGA